MNATILLVEDDDNDAFFLTRALTKAGIRNPIQRICDGREAMQYFQGEGKFDGRNQTLLPGLVLLDLKLPHVMGLEVLKWMRTQEGLQSTTVVVLSASQYPGDVESAHRNGADGYLVKPGDLDQLDVVAKTIRDAWLKPVRRGGVNTP